MSCLTRPLYILEQTLTVITDVPTSNPGKDTDCPCWYAHFKSWQGQWLSLLRCPLQILARTMTVLTEVSTSNPGKDTDSPYCDAQFKFWEAQW